MAAVELVLAVGIYETADDALADLRDLTNPGPVAEALAGTAVLSRGPRRAVLEQGGGGTTGYGIGTGAAAGVVAGAVLGRPLIGGAAGAVIGGLVGHRIKDRETGQLVALLAADLPPGCSALIAVVPERFALEVRAAMTRARKRTGRVLGDESARRLGRSLVRGNPEATEALGAREA